MYVIELLVKLYLKFKSKKENFIIEENDNNLEDILTCNHNFMPIDSTGKILVCSKCGYLIKKKQLIKRRNNQK